MNPNKIVRKLLVCGGRDYNEVEVIWGYLDKFISEWVPPVLDERVIIIEGGAKGVDKIAGNYADNRNHIHIRVPARWKKYNRAAGNLRNYEMLELFEPHVVIAFPGGTGTKNMIAAAKGYKDVRVIEVKDE